MNSKEEGDTEDPVKSVLGKRSRKKSNNNCNKKKKEHQNSTTINRNKSNNKKEDVVEEEKDDDGDSDEKTSKNKFEKIIISPIIRWQMQILLQCCMGREGYYSMGEKKDVFVTYARQLEEVIFILSMGRMDRYRNKCEQLAVALLKNTDFLIKKYDPLLLVSIEDSMLMEGTPQQRKIKEREEKVKSIQTMLSDTKIPTDQNHKPVIFCLKCGKTNIKTMTLLTRGADEGMTYFFYCMEPDCQKKWKL